MNEQFQSFIVLGVRPDASAEEVKRAYRQLARKWHPDRIQDDRQRTQAEAKLREINRAYDTLVEWQAVRERMGVSRAPKADEEEPEPVYDRTAWVNSAAQQTSASLADEDAFSLYDRALTLHFEGVKHFRAARWEEAVSSLMQSVCLVQSNAEAYRMLGSSYRRLGKPAKAASAYQTALRIEPQSVEARVGLAETYVVLGDLEAAQRERKTLERLDPELVRAVEDSIATEVPK